MAIDIREQQREQRSARAPRPGRTGWAIALTVMAVVGLTAAFLTVTLSDDPAPTGGDLLTYPEGAFTSMREGSGFVAPEHVAGFVDTDVDIREGPTPVETGASEQSAETAEAGMTSVAGAGQGSGSQDATSPADTP